MTRTDLRGWGKNYRRSSYCKVCGQGKLHRHAFCYDCYSRLPIDLQLAISRTAWSDANEVRIHTYCRAFVWLKAGPDKMDEYFPKPERW